MTATQTAAKSKSTTTTTATTRRRHARPPSSHSHVCRFLFVQKMMMMMIVWFYYCVCCSFCLSCWYCGVGKASRVSLGSSMWVVDALRITPSPILTRIVQRRASMRLRHTADEIEDCSSNPTRVLDSLSSSSSSSLHVGKLQHEEDNDHYNDNKTCSTSERQFALLQIPRGGQQQQQTPPPSLLPKQQQQQQIHHSPSPWLIGIKNSLASSLAAACSKTLLAPFDTIKTYQQYHTTTTTTASLSFWHATKHIVQRPKGILELYAGLGVAVVGAMPSVGLYFGVYSYWKRILPPVLERTMFGTVRDSSFSSSSSLSIAQQQQRQRQQTLVWTLSIATSAAIGNTVASFSRVPYEVVKQKLQTGLYSNTWMAVSDMWGSDGWRAFFPMGGVAIQMWRDIPYAVVTLLSYEYLKRSVVKPYRERQRQLEMTKQRKKSRTGGSMASSTRSHQWCDMVAGAVAGGIGSYVTNGADVVKTRLQTNPELYGGSIWKCTTMTFDEGGARAFLRGSVPRLLHKVPANGFFFLFYEFFRRVLNVDVNEESER